MIFEIFRSLSQVHDQKILSPAQDVPGLAQAQGWAFAKEALFFGRRLNLSGGKFHCEWSLIASRKRNKHYESALKQTSTTDVEKNLIH